MQAKITSTASYAMQCVEYLVTGSYSVLVRQVDGSDAFQSGTAMTATLVSGGCLGSHASTLKVDAVTEYAASFSGDKFILGYRTHFVQSMFLPARSESASRTHSDEDVFLVLWSQVVRCSPNSC